MRGASWRSGGLAGLSRVGRVGRGGADVYPNPEPPAGNGIDKPAVGRRGGAVRGQTRRRAQGRRPRLIHGQTLTGWRPAMAWIRRVKREPTSQTRLRQAILTRGTTLKRGFDQQSRMRPHRKDAGRCESRCIGLCELLTPRPRL